MSNISRNVTAGALIALTPVSATVAAVRPNAAVPVATSATTVAQAEDDDGTQSPWLPLAIIVAAIALGLYLATTDKDDRGTISRG